MFTGKHGFCLICPCLCVNLFFPFLQYKFARFFLIGLNYFSGGEVTNSEVYNEEKIKIFQYLCVEFFRHISDIRFGCLVLYGKFAIRK